MPLAPACSSAVPRMLSSHHDPNDSLLCLFIVLPWKGSATNLRFAFRSQTLNTVHRCPLVEWSSTWHNHWVPALARLRAEFGKGRHGSSGQRGASTSGYAKGTGTETKRGRISTVPSTAWLGTLTASVVKRTERCDVGWRQNNHSSAPKFVYITCIADILPGHPRSACKCSVSCDQDKQDLCSQRLVF